MNRAVKIIAVLIDELFLPWSKRNSQPYTVSDPCRTNIKKMYIAFYTACFFEIQGSIIVLK